MKNLVNGMTDSFKESRRDFPDAFDTRSYGFACAFACVFAHRHARYSFIRLRGKVPSGLFRMIRTGEYRHICRRFLHKIRRKTSGKFVSAVVTPSETASKSRRDFQPGFQERFREKIAVDFQSAPQKTAEKSPEKIARSRTRTHLRAHACKGKSWRDIRKRESVRILVLLRARSYIHYVRCTHQAHFQVPKDKPEYSYWALNFQDIQTSYIHSTCSANV